VNEPHLIVLFGATGDLARRKLLPGILHLLESDLVPESRIIGVSLDDFDDEQFREFAEQAYREFSTREVDEEKWREFAPKLSYVNVKAGPEALAKAASALEDELGGETRRLHYLSAPPWAAR
jgi:glucose-6-phosphate 1-dehydrogenase